MPTAADAMITDVKISDAAATVGQVRALFVDQHVHAALLVEGERLVAVVLREDLDVAPGPQVSAAPLGRLADRVVGPDADLDAARARLVDSGRRRLAVIAPDRRLLGLLCLKRSRAGFCSEDDLRSRRDGRRSPGVAVRSGA